jgi:hypothetical protein
MSKRRLPRIRSIRHFIERLERSDVKSLPPIERLRPPISASILKTITRTWLLQCWQGAAISPDPWDVIARIYYSLGFRKEISDWFSLLLRIIVFAIIDIRVFVSFFGISALILAVFFIVKLIGVQRIGQFELVCAAIGGVVGSLLGVISSDVVSKYVSILDFTV